MEAPCAHRRRDAYDSDSPLLQLAGDDRPHAPRALGRDRLSRPGSRARRSRSPAGLRDRRRLSTAFMRPALPKQAGLDLCALDLLESERGATSTRATRLHRHRAGGVRRVSPTRRRTTGRSPRSDAAGSSCWPPSRPAGRLVPPARGVARHPCPISSSSRAGSFECDARRRRPTRWPAARRSAPARAAAWGSADVRRALHRAGHDDRLAVDDGGQVPARRGPAASGPRSGCPRGRCRCTPRRAAPPRPGPSRASPCPRRMGIRPMLSRTGPAPGTFHSSALASARICRRSSAAMPIASGSQ